MIFFSPNHEDRLGQHARGIGQVPGGKDRKNANFDIWEQDEEFVQIMRETVGVEVQQRSMYYNYLGARTPRKGDNSYLAR
jgi:hypothetical protein